MTRRDIEITKLISERIKGIDPQADIILYGSHATGKATEDSDWDILILINKPKNSRKVENLYRDKIFELELEIGEPISTLIYSKKDWESIYSITPLYKNVQKEGINIS